MERVGPAYVFCPMRRQYRAKAQRATCCNALMLKEIKNKNKTKKRKRKKEKTVTPLRSQSEPRGAKPKTKEKRRRNPPKTQTRKEKCILLGTEPMLC